MTTQTATTTEELVQSCMSLVHHLARQYTSQNSSLSLEDLVSEGYVGLVQASQKFEEGRGVKFSTFATSRIRGAMMDSLRREMPLSRPMAERVAQYASLSEQVSAGTGREPTANEVARSLNLSPAKAVEVMRMRTLRLSSLDAQVDEQHQDIADEEETPEEQVVQTVLHEELRGHVARLTPRDREIIQRIYWLRQKHSQVAIDLGISESRVSQLQTRALGQLRRMLESDEELVAA
jgi:RNA polymerase sigma factor for flagellar operon FliA